jgi:hypothetical protein
LKRLLFFQIHNGQQYTIRESWRRFQRWRQPLNYP